MPDLSIQFSHSGLRSSESSVSSNPILLAFPMRGFLIISGMISSRIFLSIFCVSRESCNWICMVCRFLIKSASSLSSESFARASGYIMIRCSWKSAVITIPTIARWFTIGSGWLYASRSSIYFRISKILDWLIVTALMKTQRSLTGTRSELSSVWASCASASVQYKETQVLSNNSLSAFSWRSRIPANSDLQRLASL